MFTLIILSYTLVHTGIMGFFHNQNIALVTDSVRPIDYDSINLLKFYLLVFHNTDTSYLPPPSVLDLSVIISTQNVHCTKSSFRRALRGK